MQEDKRRDWSVFLVTIVDIWLESYLNLTDSGLVNQTFRPSSVSPLETKRLFATCRLQNCIVDSPKVWCCFLRDWLDRVTPQVVQRLRQ